MPAERAPSGAAYFQLCKRPIALLAADGRALTVNPAWQAAFGDGPAWLAADEQAALVGALGEANQRGAATLRTRRARDGAAVECELTASAEGCYCEARPVEPESGARMIRALSRAAPFGICLFNADGALAYANDAFWRIWDLEALGAQARAGALPPEQVVAQVRERLQLPASSERESPSDSGSLQGVELTLGNGRTLRRVLVPAQDASGADDGWLCVGADVTDRYEAQVQLQRALERVSRSEAEFRRLIEHVPDGIVVMRESQFVYANAAAARILGYDQAEQLVGMHFSAIVRPQELPRSVERVRQMGGNSPPPKNLRPMVRRDGETVYAETLGFSTQFEGAPATVVIAHDVTQELQAQAQVRQADRLASLGLLAAGVAHELNNPLAYVLLNLGQLERWLPEFKADPAQAPWGDAQALVEQSLEGAERMRVILRDLRAFSRVDDRESVLVDVRAVLESVLPMADHQIRMRAKLIRDYADTPTVRANEARLGQVFLNLLVNAAQAIPVDTGKLHEIHVQVRAEDDKVVVRVRDTGTGMSPKVLERIFEPFFTTKTADAGTGLGLSVCVGIVQGLGGTLTAHSELGKGSTFTVTLPASDGIAEDPATRRKPLSLRRTRVLVVDDEPRIAKHVAAALAGHDVVVVTSGQEASARLREENFDAVFCDLMMPDVTGMRVFEQVSAHDPKLAGRFVFMTAGAFTPQARAFLDQVPNPRLDKPFTAEQVQDLLGVVLGAAL